VPFRALQRQGVMDACAMIRPMNLEEIRHDGR